MTSNRTNLKLPSSAITIVDFSRMNRELSAVDEFMLQAGIRTNRQSLSLPRSSHNLEELAGLNGFNLLVPEDRQALKNILDDIKRSAPVIHISFAADAPAGFLIKLVDWMRREIHPLLILQVGRQPSIAVGCIVRTKSKYFDFSLRQHIKDSQPLLVEKIRQGST